MDRERLATLGKGLLVATLLAQSLGLLLVLRNEGENPELQSPAPPLQRRDRTERAVGPAENNRRQSGSSRFPKRHVSSPGAYSLRYPLGWDLEATGSVTEISSPDGSSKVSFGTGPAGNLDSSARELLSSLEQEYGDVVVAKTNRARLEGRRAWVARGMATNDSGVRLRFRVLTLGGSAGNLAALAFEKAAGRDVMRGVVTGIMQTLRPARGRGGSLSMLQEGTS